MNNLLKIIDINTLIICGGGIKGYLILGLLKLLEEKNLFKKFKFFYGTSIGGIFITCIVIGWSINEICNFMIRFPLHKLIDYNIDTFLINKGLISKIKYETLLKKLLLFKGLNNEITLLELYDKTKLELNLFTYSIKKSESKCLNYINTPNLKVWEALFMTSSVPLLLPPYYYDDDIYIDGGVLDNYPVEWLNNKNKYIGILVKQNITDYKYLLYILDDNNIIKYFKYLIYIVQTIITNTSKNNLNNTFVLIYDNNTYNTHFLDIYIDNNIKQNMINDGYNQSKNQFDNIINNIYQLQVTLLKKYIKKKSIILPEESYKFII